MTSTSKDLQAAFAPVFVTSTTGANLALRFKSGGEKAIGVVQINHGAAEHSGRYLEFATRLADAGFHVFVHDHRGHGQTTAPGTEIGVFGGDNGWDLVIKDAAFVHDHISRQFPGMPRIAVGHSMGTIVALELAIQDPEYLKGLVLLGPALGKNPALPFLTRLLKVEGLFKSDQSKSWLFQTLGWDPLNKEFKSGRTAFDWLTRDEAIVDAYVADPACGWSPTMNFGKQLIKGLMATFDDERLGAVRRDMPILVMSGARDPVTEFGKAVDELRERFQSAGMTDVTAEIIADARHELHNETNRDEFFDRLIAFCQRAVGRA